MSKSTPDNYHKLLIIFIHGFKGDDHTFKDFPVRLENALTDAIPSVEAKSLIYPRYETRGDLEKAVEMFCLWLEHTIQDKEKEINGKGDVWICLVGHSMGGILAADAIIKYAIHTESTPPKIVGLLAYDTPYFGVDHDVFTRAALGRAGKATRNITGAYTLLSNAATAGGFIATQETAVAAEKSVETTQASESGWGKWSLIAGLAAGVTAIGAAMGAAYYNKDKVSQGAEVLGGYLEFVSVLFNPIGLKERIHRLLQIEHSFHCYYTEIAPKGEYNKPRTFISVPPSNVLTYFSSIPSNNDDEIDAHISIFNPNQTNDLDNLTSKRLIEIVQNYEIQIANK
ncbi:hypothetical protein C1645_727537 [Glomus cerebriforme]|uniref:DUF676 domain-containing protein n=1 Tax=Glomus cerebriforme TaxID=658196 RepID=A0A397SNV5_9GLOM|nr:hypothetical protein C1645_727537 [Glomus cerebriforme]